MCLLFPLFFVAGFGVYLIAKGEAQLTHEKRIKGKWAALAGALCIVIAIVLGIMLIEVGLRANWVDRDWPAHLFR